MPNDYNNRRVRFRNTTDSTDVISDTAYGNGLAAIGGFPWQGDVANPSEFVEVAAGKTVEMQIWSADTNKRAAGGIAVCREVDA